MNGVICVGFYAACNSIFSFVCNINELSLLSLQESYSLAVLMYAAPALDFNVKDLMLNT